MTIYHLMGLGKSMGAVTGALSYLSERQKDADFMGAAATDPALIIFTTKAIRCGESLEAIPNSIGQTHPNPYKHRPAKQWLIDVGQPDLTGFVANQPTPLYWCEVEYNQPEQGFERVARVLYTLSAQLQRPNDQIWINLTGGSNILNSALQLASAMLGVPARLYYLSVDQSAQSYLRPTLDRRHIGTASDHYWIDLPQIFLPFRPQAQMGWQAASQSIVDSDPLLHRNTLYKNLCIAFSLSELDTLCQRLNLEPESIPHKDESRDTYARELIAYCDRRMLLPELIVAVRKERPNLTIDFDPSSLFEVIKDVLALLHEKPHQSKDLPEIINATGKLWTIDTLATDKQQRFESAILSPLHAYNAIARSSDGKEVRITPSGERFYQLVMTLTRLETDRCNSLEMLADRYRDWFIRDTL